MKKQINCIIVDDEPIAREILAAYIVKSDSLKLIRSCKNAVEAFQAISEEKLDLILLDINMPDMSGIALAKVIDPKIKVIFTTAHREYAVEGFDLQAVDYLLKPISFDRFQRAIQKLEKELKINKLTPQAAKDHHIFIRADRKMVKINYTDILYLESISDYVKIHLAEKTITTRATLSNFEKELPAKSFLRIHRSFIIATQHIHSYSKDSIEINQQQLPISRSYKERVAAFLQES